MMQRGFSVVSGGTDNHLVLVDLQNKGITGKEAEKILDIANITCNKNAVPGDPQPANITSGIRLGTPAVTSRGMVEDDMEVIAEGIDLLIADPQKNEQKVEGMIKTLTDKYPINY